MSPTREELENKLQLLQEEKRQIRKEALQTSALALVAGLTVMVAIRLLCQQWHCVHGWGHAILYGSLVPIVVMFFWILKIEEINRQMTNTFVLIHLIHTNE